jgi:hypothetical protein
MVVDGMGRIHITTWGIRPNQPAQGLWVLELQLILKCYVRGLSLRCCCCHGSNLGSQNKHAMVYCSQSKEMQFLLKTKDERQTHEEADRLTGLLKFEMVWNLVRLSVRYTMGEVTLRDQTHHARQL